MDDVTNKKIHFSYNNIDLLFKIMMSSVVGSFTYTLDRPKYDRYLNMMLIVIRALP